MNIYQKLLEVRKSVSYLQKESQGSQYSYVSSSQVLGSVREKMNEVGLILIPEIIGSNIARKKDEKADGRGSSKTTITYFTELTMKMTWVNVDNPEEKIECPWYSQGIDIAGEKGVGKALTYAEKYFILKTFNIPTDKDDPDSFQKRHEQIPERPKGDINKAKIELGACKTKEELSIVKSTFNSLKWEDYEVAELQAFIKQVLTTISDNQKGQEENDG